MSAAHTPESGNATNATNAAVARRDRPGSRSFPLVMAVFAALLGVGVLVGIAIHRRYIAFERTVAHHVPDDAVLAVRWDVEKVTLFEPTRRFLLPLLDETPTSELDPGDRSRRRRLARQGGLEIGRDLREALVVFGPQPGDWAVVAGGAFPKSGVRDAVERVLRAEGRSVRRIGDERLESPEGIAFGRGDDGVLAVASSAQRLEATLEARAPNPAVPRTGAGAFLVRDAEGLPGAARDVLAALGDVSHVEGIATWGTPLVVDISVHYRGRPPSDALARVRRVLGTLLGPGPAPPAELVSHAATTLIRVRIDDDALERGVRRASDSVHGTVWRTGRKAASP